MSLGIALSSAVSSLLVVEKQMGVVANNISNANVAGYTEQTVQVGSSVSQGIGNGVTDLGTTTNIDTYLQKTMVQSNTASAQATTYSTIYQSLQQDMGQLSLSTTGGADLSSELTTFQTTLAALGNSPDDVSLKVKAVQELDTLTANFRTLSSQVQSLRSNADSQISTTVTSVNTQLKTIAQMNVNIAQSKNEGKSTATLEDQRATALQTLSSAIGVNYYTDSTGAIQVYTADGSPLLVNNQPATLVHTANGTMNAQTAYGNASPNGIDGITINGVDITKTISTGSLRALIDQRDSELPKAQAALDNLAQNLVTTLNPLHNQGASGTSPQTLTGNVVVQGTDAVTTDQSFNKDTNLTGTWVRVAMVDSSGKAQSYADVDLTGCTTVKDVATALNAAFPASMGASAGIDGQGHFFISSSKTGQGVAMTTLSGSISGSAISATNPGTDLSSYFHMNDLLTGNSAATISVRSDLLGTPSLLADGKLNSNANPGLPPFTAVGAGDGTTALALSDAMSKSQSFKAAGYLGAASVSFGGYAANLISDVANRAATAKADATSKEVTFNTFVSNFSSTTGVNVDEQTAKLSNLQNTYAASAKIVSTVSSMFQSLLAAVNV